MKRMIVLTLLLPLLFASSALLDPPEGSYRVHMKFQSGGALPGELLCNDSELPAQTVTESTLPASRPVFGNLSVCNNASHLSYQKVAIHILNAVFVI